MRRSITTLFPAVLCALGSSSAPSAFAQYEPAATPALAPAEAEKKFAVPAGFEVRLFAAEPDVVNPVAMSWDSRGRLWVLELLEYPLGAKAGQKPRDRVKILEDTDGDGRADKVTVFADGLNLATGLLCGDGGVYVGQAPDLLFLKDTNGDDVADERTVLLTGFGLNDRHELLNGFAWGPDGWLWLTHGVFVHSKVKDPANPDDDGVQMNAAIARFHPRTRKFEIVADGTSNPWGVDFDRAGNAFVSACVIDHLFHIVPGGSYVRQAGTPGNPYAYDLLPTIADHKHQRAAYCGINIYQGDQFPEEYRGNAYMGNIHANCINRDKLTPDGSSFKAAALPDFLTANDGWFRPIALHDGPDGAMWIADWYDKYPCYQNAMATPDLIDRERGRIWRVVYVGAETGAPRPACPVKENLDLAGGTALAELLQHPNIWQRRTARRIVTERGQDQPRVSPKPAVKAPDDDIRLSFVWSLHGLQAMDRGRYLETLAGNPAPDVRAWAARLTAEHPETPDPAAPGSWQNDLLSRLSRDPDPTVRLNVAIASRRLRNSDPAGILTSLAAREGTDRDPLLPFFIWTAMEPRVAENPAPYLAWFLANGGRPLPLAAALLRKTVRRLCDTGNPARVDDAVRLLEELFDRQFPALTMAALDGFLEGQQGKVLKPAAEWAPVLRKLAGHPDAAISGAALRLAALWGDAEAAAKMLAAAADPAAPEGRRIEAVRTARRVKGDAAREVILNAFIGEAGAAHEPPLHSGPPAKSALLIVELLRAMADIGGDGVPDAILSRWKALPSDARRAALDVLASRPAWAAALLSAVETKAVAAADVPAPARRALSQIEDPAVQAAFGRAFGKFRQTPDEKAKVIAEKKLMVLNGPVDSIKGRQLVKKTCLTCHSFLGEGANVGPDLTGVGRSTLDALLANVIDPSQVIGEGYENTIVQTKDEQIFTGRVVADTPEKMTLLSAGPVEKTIPKDEIDVIRKTDQSLMPEGLWQMPDTDFRNLIWYVFSPPSDPTLKLRVDSNGDSVWVDVRHPSGEDWIALPWAWTSQAKLPFITFPGNAVGRNHPRPMRSFPLATILPRLGQISSVKFEGENADGKHRFLRLLDAKHEEGQAGWRAEFVWAGPEGKTLIEEEQTVSVHDVEPGKGYAVDVAWTLRGLQEKWTIVVGSESNGLAMNLVDAKGAAVETAAGRLEPGAPVQKSEWGLVCIPAADAGAPPVGIVWLSHPANPGGVPAWRLGPDGTLNPSANPYGDWGVSAKGPRTYRYRFLVRPGPVDPAAAAAELERFKAVAD